MLSTHLSAVSDRGEDVPIAPHSTPSIGDALDPGTERQYIVGTKDLHFEWSPEKAEANLAKHGVSLDEAMTVFYDDWAVEFYDDEHSEWEDRFLLLGLSDRTRLLMVCHCHQVDESVTRLISARRATQNEAKYYRR